MDTEAQTKTPDKLLDDLQRELEERPDLLKQDPLGVQFKVVDGAITPAPEREDPSSTKDDADQDRPGIQKPIAEVWRDDSADAARQRESRRDGPLGLGAHGSDGTV